MAWHFCFLHVSGLIEPKKIWEKFLVEILQYTKNLENVHILASMKTKQVCICSAFWKHGWILLKFGMQVSIGYGIIENENRV